MALRNKKNVLFDGSGRNYLECSYAIWTGEKLTLNICFIIGFLNDEDVEYVRNIHKTLSASYDSLFSVNQKQGICLHSITITGATISELFTEIDVLATKTPFAYRYISDMGNNNKLSPLKKDIINDITTIYTEGNRSVRRYYDQCEKILENAQ